MVRLGICAALAGICACLAGPRSAAAEDAFYKGKRLTMMVNYAAGGPTDIEGRLFARHIANHIDGQPNIIVQNMDGAGGLIGTDLARRVAPKDGTAMGYLTGAAWLYASEPDEIPRRFPHLRVRRLSARHLDLLRAHRRGARHEGRRRHRQGARASSPAGSSADNSKDLLMRLALDMLGVPYRHVTGYRSNNTARMALQQNEINFFSESPPGYRSVVEPSLVKDGIVIPTWYDPGWNGESILGAAAGRGADHPALPRGLSAESTARRRPDNFGTSISSASLSTARCSGLLVLPPGVPPAALQALRAAVMRAQQRQGLRRGGDARPSASCRNTSPDRRPTGRCARRWR